MRRAHCRGYFLYGGKARLGTPRLPSRGETMSALDEPELRVDLLWFPPFPEPPQAARRTSAISRRHERQAVPSRARRRLRTWER